jgi:hypothetical protein
MRCRPVGAAVRWRGNECHSARIDMVCMSKNSTTVLCRKR